MRTTTEITLHPRKLPYGLLNMTSALGEKLTRTSVIGRRRARVCCWDSRDIRLKPLDFGAE